jgi:hypothetical protein
MLRMHPNRVCTIFAVDFEPQIGYVRSLPEAVDEVQRRLSVKHWACGPDKYILRNTDQRYFLMFEVSRFTFASLGLGVWISDNRGFIDLYKMALERMRIAQLKRIGFRTQAFMNLEMSHPEICELMFGSYLVPAKELESVCGKPDDLLVQLHGTYKDMKTRTILAPVTSDQAVQHFISNNALDLFVEPRLFDTGALEFRNRIAQDGLIVDSDLFIEKTTTDQIQTFTKDSLEASDQIAQAAVYRVKRLHN